MLYYMKYIKLYELQRKLGGFRTRGWDGRLMKILFVNNFRKRGGRGISADLLPGLVKKACR
jgi:hypothetical protein